MTKRKVGRPSVLSPEQVAAIRAIVPLPGTRVCATTLARMYGVSVGAITRALGAGWRKR